MKRAATAWVVTCLLGPAVGWLAGSTFYALYDWSWHWRLEARVVLGAGLPALTALWLSAKMIGARRLALLPVVWLATLLAAYSTRPAVEDLRAGPVPATVRVATTDVIGSAHKSFLAHLADGSELDYDDAVADAAYDGKTIHAVILGHTGAILSVEGAKQNPAEPFDWRWWPLFLAACVPGFWLGVRAIRRTRFVAGAEAPSDGRRWITGSVLEHAGYREADRKHAATVYLVARAGLTRYKERRLEELPCFGWSPAALAMDTAEGPVEVDLRDAWYALPNKDEHNVFNDRVLADNGCVRVGRDDPAVKQAHFTATIPPGSRVEIWRAHLAPGAGLAACGFLDGGKLRGGGPERPLLVADGAAAERGPSVARLTDVSFGRQVRWWLWFGGAALAAFIYTLTGVVETRWPWLGP